LSIRDFKVKILGLYLKVGLYIIMDYINV